MIVEVSVPQVGESITEGVLLSWSKNDGDLVGLDDPLFELETDKVTITVAAKQAGRLSIKVGADTKVLMGQVVGAIDTDFAQGSVAASRIDTSAPANILDDFSPAVRRLLAQHHLAPAQIKTTGKNGRLTKEDIVLFLEDRARTKNVTEISTSNIIVDSRQTRQRMSMLRQRIAERLVESQNTAAILTTFNEVDMSAIQSLRTKHGDAFQKKHAVKLGLMSFFIKASIAALKAVPAVNAFIDADEIVFNNYYNIGVAVSTEQGLVVPVIRDADQFSLSELEKIVASLAQKARQRKLELADLSGGTFSISNGGVFGSMLSTPIINPPQSGILGMHAIKKRAMVVEEQIVIRPMMYLAFSYDHRLIDGRESVTFLKHIVDFLENPAPALMEEVHG